MTIRTEAREREQAWLSYQCGFCKSGSGPSATIGLIGRRPFKYICLTCIGKRVLGEEFFEWVHQLGQYADASNVKAKLRHTTAAGAPIIMKMPHVSRPKDRSLNISDLIPDSLEKRVRAARLLA